MGPSPHSLPAPLGPAPGSLRARLTALALLLLLAQGCTGDPGARGADRALPGGRAGSRAAANAARAGGGPHGVSPGAMREVHGTPGALPDVSPGELCDVPAGPFWMGDDEVPDEAPRRQVTLPAYRIERTEVTVAQFRRFISSGGYAGHSAWSDAGLAWRRRAGGRPALLDQEGDRPVTNVSFYEAEAYCRWAGRALPTEAQWEKAARGTDGRRFPWGNSPDRRRAHHWKQALAVTLTEFRLWPAASWPLGQSPFGALHMAGNAAEWTRDRYARGRPPGAGSPWIALRGGSWNSLLSYLRTSHREPGRPELRRPDLGFRCVLPPVAAAAAARRAPGAATAATASGPPPAPGELVSIPAGEGWMGFGPGPARRRKARRRVWLDAFEIGRTEVTVAQYARFVREAGYKPPFVLEPWAAALNWVDGQPPPGKEQHPVLLINWFDADAYCRWRGMALPTEAQWERAALGAEGRRYPWGETWDAGACNHGQKRDFDGDDAFDPSDGYRLTAPVGTFPGGRSPHGLEDAFGNAWEWTADWFTDTWRPVRARRRGGALLDPRGPALGILRTARGGSYYFSLDRDRDIEPQGMFPQTRRKTTGFRCARRRAGPGGER